MDNELDALERQQNNAQQASPSLLSVRRKCAACGTEKPLVDMKVCMDSLSMRRYVCDSKCMIEFYA